MQIQQADNMFTISCQRLEEVGELASRLARDLEHGVVVAPTGELDLATAPVLEEELRRAEISQELIVLDLRGVTFMDSTGVRMMIAADQRARDRGRHWRSYKARRRYGGYSSYRESQGI